MRRSTILLLSAVLLLVLEAACIGRQPSQQGTWSKQDGFKTKVTDMAGWSPQNPDSGR